MLANTQLQWGIIDPYSRVVRERYGEERFRQMYKFRTFVDHGVRVSLGMDALACSCRLQHRPVEHIESGHTRQPCGRGRCIGDARGLRAHAASGSHCRLHYQRCVPTQTRDEVGSLVVGKRADLIVLAEERFESEPHAIHSIDVLLTIMNGRVTHDAGTITGH